MPSDLVPLHDGMILSFVNYELRVKIEKKTGDELKKQGEAQTEFFAQRDYELQLEANKAPKAAAAAPVPEPEVIPMTESDPPVVEAPAEVNVDDVQPAATAPVEEAKVEAPVEEPVEEKQVEPEAPIEEKKEEPVALVEEKNEEAPVEDSKEPATEEKQMEPAAEEKKDEPVAEAAPVEDKKEEEPVAQAAEEKKEEPVAVVEEKMEE